MTHVTMSLKVRFLIRIRKLTTWET